MTLLSATICQKNGQLGRNRQTISQTHPEQREKKHVNKIRNENGEITTDTQKYKGS